MIQLLEDNRTALEALCRRYGVRRLEVFGSAATGAEFDAGSDVDLMVEFEPGTDLGPWLAHYFSLQDDLQALLGRPVDLVISRTRPFENPYFAREVERTRRLLYAA